MGSLRAPCQKHENRRHEEPPCAVPRNRRTGGVRDFCKIFPVLLFSCRRGPRTRRPCLRLRSLLFSCFRAGAGLERIGSAASCSPVFVPARAPNAAAPPAAVPRTDGRGRTRTGERTGTAHVDLRQVGLRLGTVRSEIAASAPGPRKLGSAPAPGARERGLSPSNSGRISLRISPTRSRTSRFGGERQTPSAGYSTVLTVATGKAQSLRCDMPANLAHAASLNQ